MDSVAVSEAVDVGSIPAARTRPGGEIGRRGALLALFLAAAEWLRNSLEPFAAARESKPVSVAKAPKLR